MARRSKKEAGLLCSEGRLLTTGVCAQILGVAPRTVNRWVDAGFIRGYRLPGSRDRRVHAGELLNFCLRSGFPPEVCQRAARLAGPCRLTICTSEEPILVALREMIPSQMAAIQSVDSWLALGRLGTLRGVLVLDTAHFGRTETLRHLPDLLAETAEVLILAAEDEAEHHHQGALREPKAAVLYPLAAPPGAFAGAHVLCRPFLPTAVVRECLALLAGELDRPLPGVKPLSSRYLTRLHTQGNREGHES